MDTLEARTECRAKKTTPTGGRTEELSARNPLVSTVPYGYFCQGRQGRFVLIDQSE